MMSKLQFATQKWSKNGRGHEFHAAAILGFYKQICFLCMYLETLQLYSLVSKDMHPMK